ncbi:MAG TPA: DUF4157 domain-containing protein [Cyanophyceae cyanobacterium]
MYKPLQKKSSSWASASIQKKSKNFSKPGSSAIQQKPNSQEIPNYSTTAADLLAANVMRSLENKEQDEPMQMSTLVQRAFQGGGTQASGDLESRLNASQGGGNALAPEVRAFMEPRFGADFSAVRVHTGGEAVQMNRELGAQAFTHGSNVYFGEGKSPGNNELTAHELTHVVQQTGGVQRLCSECESELSDKEEKQPIQAKLELGQPGDKYEQEADAVAYQVVNKINAPQTKPPVQRQSELGAKPELHISIERSASVIRRLTSEQFRTQLGSTPEQKAAIDTLFANPTFLALWNYLKNCQATPQQDLGPLRLKVTPGLRISGVERFGGYNPLTKTLEINPTKAEHVSNPTELVDTIVHEMIHAVDDLQADCVQAGSPPAPLQGAATQTAPSRADVAGTPDEARLMTELGPGASNPCEEFIDINAAAQQMIVQILTENIQVSRVGRPTLTFVNVILRRNPAAMSEYEVCRGNACALPDQNARRRAIAHCSAEIIGKYIPPDLLPSLLPTRIYFDFGAERLRPDSVETLDLVGLFLMSHPDTSVNLTGHADPVGSEAVNLRMGQLRAEAVAQQLIRKGVDPKQILSVTSQGEANPLSTSRDTHWKDRRVEVVPS